MIHLFKKLKEQLNGFNAKRELRKYAPALNKEAEGLSAEDLIRFIFSEKWQRFFWIKQIQTEILALCKLIEAKKPKTILEIGTANGGTLFLTAKLAHPEAHIISLDLPDGQFGGGYPSFKEEFYKSFASKNQSIDLIRADSHQLSSLNQVKKMLGDKKLDYLFIDGDHTYEGVKQDYEMYAPLTDNSAMIAFHDIAVHPESWNVQVNKLWDEIKANYACQEFIENKLQGWAGIGVLFKNQN